MTRPGRCAWERCLRAPTVEIVERSDLGTVVRSFCPEHAQKWTERAVEQGATAQFVEDHPTTPLFADSQGREQVLVLKRDVKIAVDFLLGMQWSGEDQVASGQIAFNLEQERQFNELKLLIERLRATLDTVVTMDTKRPDRPLMNLDVGLQ